MNEILAGPEGVLCHMDDVLIFGQDQQEHDSRLQAALQKIQEAGTMLNPEKCEFSKQSLTFLGHIVSQNGISPDPSNLSAMGTTTAEVGGAGVGGRAAICDGAGV